MRRTLDALSEHYAEVQSTRASAAQEAASLHAQLKATEKSKARGGSAAMRGGHMQQLVAAVESATKRVQDTNANVPDPVVDETMTAMSTEYTRTARAVLRGLEEEAPHMVGPVRELLAVVPEFHSAAERRRMEAEHARKTQRKALLWRKASFATSMLGDDEGGSSSGEEGGVHEIKAGQSFRLGPSSGAPHTPHRLTSPFSDGVSPKTASPGSPDSPPDEDMSFMALKPVEGGYIAPGPAPTSSAATRLRRAVRHITPSSPTIPEGNEGLGGLSLPDEGGGDASSGSVATGTSGARQQQQSPDHGRHLEDDITEDTDLLKATHDGLLHKVTSDLRRRQLTSSFTGSFHAGAARHTQQAPSSFSTVAMSPKRRGDKGGGNVSFSPPQEGDSASSGSDSETEGVFKGGRLHHAARRLISALRVSKAVRSNTDPRGAWGNADAPRDSLPSRAEAALVAATASLGGGGVQRVAGGGFDVDEDELADESHADRSMAAAPGLLGTGEELAPSLPLEALAGRGGRSPGPQATRGNAFMAAARSSMLRPRLATEAIAAQVGEALPPGEGMRPGLAPDQGGGAHGVSLETVDGDEQQGVAQSMRPRASRPMNMSWGDAAAAARPATADGASPVRSGLSSSLRPWSAGHAAAGPHSTSLMPARPATAQGLGSPSQRPSVSLGPDDLGLGRSAGRTRSQSARRAREGSLREPAFRPSAAVFALTTGTAEHRRIIARDNTLHHAMTAEVGGIAAPLVRRLRQHVQTLEQESEVQTELASRAIADLRSRLGSYHEGKRSWAVRNGAPIARRMDELAGVLADMEGETKAQTSALGGVDRMLLKMKGLTDKWAVKAQAQAARRWRDVGSQTDLTAPLDSSLEAHFRAKMAAEFDAEIQELKIRRKHAAALGGGLLRVSSQRSAVSSRSAAASLSAPPRVAAVYHMYGAPPLLPPMRVLGHHAAHGPGTWLWHFLSHDTTPSLHAAGIARSLIALGPLLDTAEGILRTKAASDATRDAEGLPRVDIWAHALSYFKQSFGAEGGSKGVKSASMGPRRTLGFLHTLHAYSQSPLAHLHPVLGFLLGVFGLSSTPLFGVAHGSPLQQVGYDTSHPDSTPVTSQLSPLADKASASHLGKIASPRASSVLLNVSADTLDVHRPSRNAHGSSYASRLMHAVYWDARSLGAHGLRNTASSATGNSSVEEGREENSAIQGALAPPLQDSKNTALFLVEGQASIHHTHLVDSLTEEVKGVKGGSGKAAAGSNTSLLDPAGLLPPFGAPFVHLPQPKDLLDGKTVVPLTPCGAPLNMDSLPLPEYFPALRAAFLSTCASIAEKYKGVLQGRGITNRAGTPSKRPPSAGSHSSKAGVEVPGGMHVPPPKTRAGTRKSVAASSGDIHLDLTRLMSPYAVHAPPLTGQVLSAEAPLTWLPTVNAHAKSGSPPSPNADSLVSAKPRPRRASSPGFRGGGAAAPAGGGHPWDDACAVPLADWAGDTEEGGTVDGGGEDEEVLFRLEDEESSPAAAQDSFDEDGAIEGGEGGLKDAACGDTASAPGSPKKAPPKPHRRSMPGPSSRGRPSSAGAKAPSPKMAATPVRSGMHVDTGFAPASGNRPSSAGAGGSMSPDAGFESIKKPPSLPLSPVFEARASGQGSPKRRQGGPLTDADVGMGGDTEAVGDATGLSLQPSSSAVDMSALGGGGGGGQGSHAPREPSTLYLDGEGIPGPGEDSMEKGVPALRPRVWRAQDMGTPNPAADSNVYTVAQDAVSVMTTAERVQAGQAVKGGIGDALLAETDAAWRRLQVAMGVRASGSPDTPAGAQAEETGAVLPSAESNKQQRVLMAGMSERNVGQSEHIWVPLSPLLESLRPYMAGVGHLPARHRSPFSHGQGGECSILEYVQEELLAHSLLPALAGDQSAAWSDPFVVTPGGRGGGSLDLTSHSAEGSPRRTPRSSRSVSPRRAVPTGPAARLPAKLRLSVSQKRDLLAKEKFVNALAKLGIGSLRGTFQRMDVDDSGEISVGEMKRFITEVRIPMTSSEVSRLIRSMAGSSAGNHTRVTFMQFTNAFREVHATGGMLVVEAHVAARLILNAHLQAVQMIEANWASAFIAADWTCVQEQHTAARGTAGAKHSHSSSSTGMGERLAEGHLGALSCARFMRMLLSLAPPAAAEEAPPSAALPPSALPFTGASSVLQADVFMATDQTQQGMSPGVGTAAIQESLLDPQSQATAAGVAAQTSDGQWRIPPGAVTETAGEVLDFMGVDASLVLDVVPRGSPLASKTPVSQGALEAASVLKGGPMGREGVPASSDVASSLHDMQQQLHVPPELVQYGTRLFALAASRTQARLQWAASMGRPVATDGNTPLETDTAVPRTAATSAQSQMLDLAPLIPGLSLHGKWVPPVAALSLSRGARPSAMVWSGSADSLVELGLAKASQPSSSLQQGHASQPAVPAQRLSPTLHTCMASLYDLLEIARRFNLTAPTCKWSLKYTLLTAHKPRGTKRPGVAGASNSDATPPASVATPHRSRPTSAVSSLSASRRRAAVAHGGPTAAWSPSLDTEDAASESFFAAYMAQVAPAAASSRGHSAKSSRRPLSAGTHRSTSTREGQSEVSAHSKSPSVDVGRPLRPGSAIMRPGTAHSSDTAKSAVSGRSRTPERATLFRYHEQAPRVSPARPSSAGGDRASTPPPHVKPQYALQTSPIRSPAGRGVDTDDDAVLDVVARYTLASSSPEKGGGTDTEEYLTLDDIAPSKNGVATVRVAPFNMYDNADGQHQPRLDGAHMPQALRASGLDAVGDMTRKGASPQRQGTARVGAAASPRFVYSRQRPMSTPPRASPRQSATAQSAQHQQRSLSAGRRPLLVEDEGLSPPHSPVEHRMGHSSSAGDGVLSVGPEGGPTQPVSPFRAQHEVTQRLSPAAPRGTAKVRGFHPHSPTGSHADTAVRSALAHVHRSQMQRVSLAVATDDTLSRVGRGSRSYVVPAPPEDAASMRVGPMSRRPHRHASYVLPRNAGAVIRGRPRQQLDAQGRASGSTEVLPPVDEPRPSSAAAAAAAAVALGAAVKGGRTQGKPPASAVRGGTRAQPQGATARHSQQLGVVAASGATGVQGRALGSGAAAGQLRRSAAASRQGPLGGAALQGSF